MMGPCIAIEPSTAKVARPGGRASNERCANSLWKPTVIPIPASAYMKRVIANVPGSTQRSQSSTMARISPAKGRKTPRTFPIRLPLVTDARLRRVTMFSPRSRQECVTREGKLHTFLIADISGYSTLTEIDGDEAAAAVAISLPGEVYRLAAEHGAEVVKTLGDAAMIRCDSAAEAIELGLRLQDES